MSVSATSHLKQNRLWSNAGDMYLHKCLYTVYCNTIITMSFNNTILLLLTHITAWKTSMATHTQTNKGLNKNMAI